MSFRGKRSKVSLALLNQTLSKTIALCEDLEADSTAYNNRIRALHAQTLSLILEQLAQIQEQLANHDRGFVEQDPTASGALSSSSASPEKSPSGGAAAQHVGDLNQEEEKRPLAQQEEQQKDSWEWEAMD